MIEDLKLILYISNMNNQAIMVLTFSMLLPPTAPPKKSNYKLTTEIKEMIKYFVIRCLVQVSFCMEAQTHRGRPGPGD